MKQTKVGRYQLGNQLGRGGMGAVYEATDTATGRRVALKLLSLGRARDKMAVDRFLREAQLAAQISHPRTTFVFEAGEDRGRPFIVMELMPGRTLQDELDEHGHLTVGQAVDHMLDVIDGLIAAHQLNVIHRDVKPSNCFLDTAGRVKVGDFGLSKSLVTDANLTRTGMFMGTPLFAAPEQLRGDDVDQRTDVYAVGATLFTLISGRPPFEGDAMSVTAQIVSDTAPTLKSLVERVPRGLDRVVARTLHKNPDERFQNLLELKQALLPFSKRNRALAEMARRAAAYMIDYILLTSILHLLQILVAVYLELSAGFLERPELATMRTNNFLLICGIVGWPMIVAYFAVGDGLFGRTIGKRLMGLRVINNDGEAPGIWRGLVRSVMIPGAIGIPVVGLLLRLNSVEQTVGALDFSVLMSLVLRIWMFLRLMELLPGLVCLVSMRPANGLRGIHGLVSGTRVIRVVPPPSHSLMDELILPNVDAVPADTPSMIGPFHIYGLLAQNHSARVYVAKDESLNRHAWVFCFARQDQMDQHPDVHRHGRARCLQHGRTDDCSWYACEAVEGVPFAMAAEQSGIFTWENTRQAVLDLARELEVAIQDQSLPRQLELSQFWIERKGSGKLLDFPLPNSPETVPGTEITPAERACRLLQSVFELIQRRQILPERVRQFFDEFSRRPNDEASIAWAVERLDEAAHRTASVKRNVRLGVLGATIGIEWIGYSAIAFLTLFFYFRNLGWWPAWKMVLPLVVLCGVFFGLGYWLRGGPVFRFMGIDVQNQHGRLASRWRSGFRNLVAWFPFAVYMVCVAPLVVISIDMVRLTQNGEKADVSLFSSAVTFIVVIIFCNLLIYAGALYAVRHPQRGIPDQLAGTRLVPH